MRFSLFVAVAVVAALAIAPIGAAAVVQEDAMNATDDQNESELAPELEDELDQSEIKERIDPTLVITNWQYEDQTFTLTLRSAEAQEIVIAEAIRAEEGTGRQTWSTHDLEEGNQTIDVPVRTAPKNMRKGAAITIASERSREAGHATYVSSGMIEPNREPVDYQIVQLLLFGSAVGGAGYAFRRVRNSREGDDKEVDRIA